MQKTILAFVFILNYQFITLSVFSQVPERMSYQAVIRDNSNALVTNTDIGIKISILQTSTSGTAVFEETHSPTTNENGLVSIEIGGGTVVSGSFSSINWANETYFLKIETDPTGGTNYSISGTSQLLSVPYAMHAKTAEHVVKESQNLSDVLSVGNLANNQIKNVADPTDASDAATKAYTDRLQQEIADLENMLYENGLMRVKDIDGNSYSMVKIGEQVWMAQNLKATKYNDGSDIPYVTGNTAWTTLTTPAYCWYSNDSSYKDTYGALYNWYTVETDNLCPTGWHVPSEEEWRTLIDYLGGASTAGGKLKETGTDHWKTPNSGATNESNFTALPGGYRNTGFGQFYVIEEVGEWWTATGVSFAQQQAWYVHVDYNHGSLYVQGEDKKTGRSIRCIKD